MVLTLKISGQKPRFDRFDISNGLSQNNINGLVIDDRGNVWAGTLDGLNRFNGCEFQVFKPRTGKNSHISGNHINALGKGLNPDIWVTTRGDVLSHYMVANKQFQEFSDTIFQKTDIQSEQITDFACYHLKSDGDKWYAVSSEGICELDRKLSVETITLAFDESGPEYFYPLMLMILPFTGKQSGWGN